ncbi:DNA oxidative demethylase ALKBH2 [Trichonephila clavipes]|nr:DNA oxidative demethylase ALKBH2 [Trichonephila clavipes]
MENSTQVIQKPGLFLALLGNEKYKPNTFSRLKEEIEYLPPEQTQVRVYGKWSNVPRQIAFYGDKGLTYTFSDHTFEAKEPVPIVKELQDEANNLIKKDKGLNFCVVNHYINGLDRIGLHRDNEKYLNSDYPIVCFSFGAILDIIFKREGYEKVVIPLTDGSVLIKYSPTNEFWLHEIPIRRKVKDTRISLTFRRIENKILLL